MATNSNNTNSKLNLSKNEINRIENALKDKEFVKLLSEYANELQDPENKQFFVPDKLMEPIFGKEKIRAFGMAKHLKTHLSS